MLHHRNPSNRATQISRKLAVQIQIEISAWFELVPRDLVDCGDGAFSVESVICVSMCWIASVCHHVRVCVYDVTYLCDLYIYACIFIYVYMYIYIHDVSLLTFIYMWWMSRPLTRIHMLNSSCVSSRSRVRVCCNWCMRLLSLLTRIYMWWLTRSFDMYPCVDLHLCVNTMACACTLWLDCDVDFSMCWLLKSADTWHIFVCVDFEGLLTHIHELTSICVSTRSRVRVYCCNLSTWHWSLLTCTYMWWLSHTYPFVGQHLCVITIACVCTLLRQIYVLILKICNPYPRVLTVTCVCACWQLKSSDVRYISICVSPWSRVCVRCDWSMMLIFLRVDF